jgi:hypothetical protein
MCLFELIQQQGSKTANSPKWMLAAPAKQDQVLEESMIHTFSGAQAHSVGLLSIFVFMSVEKGF